VTSGGHAEIPERSTPRPPDTDDDDRASVRIRLAALMLRRGDDVGEVSVATDVPVALLELLRAEVAEEADLNEQCRAAVAEVRRRRRIVIAVLVVEVAAVGNVVVGLSALVGHFAGLGLSSTLIAAALLLAVYAVITHSSHSGCPTGHSGSVARREGHGHRPRE
jgi:hypothetical protein